MEIIAAIIITFCIAAVYVVYLKLMRSNSSLLNSPIKSSNEVRAPLNSNVRSSNKFYTLDRPLKGRIFTKKGLIAFIKKRTAYCKKFPKAGPYSGIKSGSKDVIYQTMLSATLYRYDDLLTLAVSPNYMYLDEDLVGWVDEYVTDDLTISFLDPEDFGYDLKKYYFTGLYDD